jgi:hypothetical protein
MAENKTDQTAAPAKARVGFNDKGERVSLTYEGTLEEFGADRGAIIYGDVARAGGYFDPNTESANYRPPLDLSGLKGKAKEQVEYSLAGKE